MLNAVYWMLDFYVISIYSVNDSSSMFLTRYIAYTAVVAVHVSYAK